MTALLYGIIQTTAYNNRFELGPNQSTDEVAVFASVHHPNQMAITDDAARSRVWLSTLRTAGCGFGIILPKQRE